MPVIYGQMNVDERYAASFEPNLYHEAWMIPGVTYTDKYTRGPAGGFQIHKYTKATAITPGTPGRDFTHELAEDDLISIVLNNNFMKSRKLYGVAINAIEAPAAEELMADTTGLAKESINGSGLAALITEATALSNTAAITEQNVKSILLGARTELSSKAASSAKVVLASPATYTAFLAAANIPGGRTETIQGTGVIRDWYGFTIIEASQLGAGAALTYKDYSGTSRTVSATDLAKVNFIVYDYNAFSALTNLEVFRLIDGGKDFNGVLSQVEVNMGYRVTNPDLVYVHKTTTT